jgi:Flp pilus assembly protein TadG
VSRRACRGCREGSDALSGRPTPRFGPPRGDRAAGQALVELALVAPILILIVASIVQLAIIFERQIGIENAVREAARRGATQATPDSTTAAANATWTLAQLNVLLGNSQTHDAGQDQGLQACYVTPATPDVSGNMQVFVTVHAGYLHPVFLPLISNILDGIDGSSDGGLRVDTSSTFRVEQAGTNDIGSTPVCAP